MSDDRELVELLAAIDATPRAGWVAGLRADLDAVWEIEDAGYLDSLRTTTVALVDHEPTQPTSGHRWPILIAAAAAVLLVGVLVVYDGDRVTPADEPSPIVTVPPTVPPQPLPNKFGPIAPGTYYVDEVDGTPTPRIFATFGAGWWDRCDQCEGWTWGVGFGKRVPHPDDGKRPLFDETTFDDYLQRDIGLLSFSHPEAVYSDACHWEDGYHPGPVDTVDGLVTALIEQRGWADVTAPSDISIDGYVGIAFQRTAPADMSDCTFRSYATRTSSGSGRNPDFRSWEIPDFEFNNQYEPSTIEILWVLDLEGTMVVISTTALPEPSAGASADFAADVLDSIRIERL